MDARIAQRLAEGNWSNVGWDQDTVMVEVWLDQITKGQYTSVQGAIDELFTDVIRLLEGHTTNPKGERIDPGETKEEDLEFLITEIARLQSIRDNLTNSNK